jgi:rare lipoprotein A
MRLLRRAAATLALLVLAGCAQAPVQAMVQGQAPDGEPAAADGVPAEPSPAVVVGEGLASWYGLEFQGRRTASGERFDMNALTAAHPSLPFGTRVEVRNPANGRTVTVRINDRGPHVAGRIIDLSHAAARSLGLLGLGTRKVVLSVLADAPASRRDRS